MDPLIKEYVSSNSPPDAIFEKFAKQNPDNKLYQRIASMSKLLAAPRNRQLRFQFEDIPLEQLDKRDNNLLALFYQLGARLAYYYQRSEVGYLLLTRSRAYLDKNSPPYLVLVTEAGLQPSNVGNSYAEKHLLKHVESSPRYQSAFELYFSKMALQGLKPNEHLVKFYLSSKHFASDERFLELADFYYCIETHQLEKAKAFGLKLFSNYYDSMGGISAQHQEILPLYKLLYRILTNDSTCTEMDCQKNKNVLILYLLKQKQCKRALEIARQYFTYDLSTLLCCNQTRCELVNGHFEGAFRSLQGFADGDEVEKFYYHFYLARVEIGQGRRKEALRSFSTARQISSKMNLDHLLDFELSLSYELAVTDLRYLFENINQINSEEQQPTAIASFKTNSKVKDILIGTSQVMQTVCNNIALCSSTSIPVLITGETGVGKDLVARLIHEQSDRAQEPFLSVNCGAITESLLQSELFGHSAGAFTGAVKDHKGLFEASGAGTLFLDEIGEISPVLQIALLRVLDQQEYLSIGSTKIKKSQCRILFATNADLEKLADKNKFRKDLLYRLKRLEITIPPLRERKEDIPLLVKHYLQLDRSDNQVPDYSEMFIQTLVKYDWPGNVRQLKNEIEKLRVLHSEKLSYDTQDLPSLGLGDAKKHIDLVAQPTLHMGEPSPNKTDASYKNPLRRRERLVALFKEHKKLTRKEVISILKNSPTTVTLDLEFLCKEGLIKRVSVGATVRNDYFVWIEDR